MVLTVHAGLKTKITYFTGSPKKHETWRKSLGLLTDILERMKGHSIKTNMPTISVMLLEFYSIPHWGLIYSIIRVYI